MTAQRDPQIHKNQPSADQIQFNSWKEHVRDRESSRAQAVKCPAVLYCSAVSLCRLDRETLEELADDVPLWSLYVDLGAGRDTLVCRWRGKEIGFLRVLQCSYLAPGSLGRMPAGLGLGADARSRSSEPLTLWQEEPEMVCEHLSALEQQMLSAGLRVTFRGQAWSRNCREWVYFDCLLDRTAIRERIEFAPCVKDYEHLGTHDGQEAGFVCEECHDAIMGVHRQSWHPSTPVYRGAPTTGCR